MIELLTAAGVIVAGAYAWFTYRILQANQATVAAMQRQVAIMEEQTRAMMRPYVTVSAAPEKGSILFLLRVANSGRSSAERVRLRLDKPFHQFGDKRDEKDLSKLNAFSNEIPMLAPASELVFHLGTSIQIFGGGTAGEMPQVFTISAAYEDNRGNKFEEFTTVDLRALYQSAVVKDRGVEELKEIAGAVKALARAR
jgi:hypothetical protein